jgi:hypothetical protein
VADANVISMFWDDITCHTLVHALDREEPKTTKELLNIATWHTSSKEVVGPAFLLGNADITTNGGRAAPTKTTIKRARKGTKGSKKGLKQWPYHVTIVTGYNGDDEEADDSSKEGIAATEHDSRCQMRLPKNHFKKLLEATCLHHSYPVKHKLKDCTMMKKFMTWGGFSQGRKPGGDSGGKSAVLIPGEGEVMSIFDWLGRWHVRQNETHTRLKSLSC